jgi:hypothetical protein
MTWKTCKTHGPAKPNVWGCPECVRELREENSRLRDSAGEVISSFEMLGRAEGIVATRDARARCERVMVALKQALTPNVKWGA